MTAYGLPEPTIDFNDLQVEKNRLIREAMELAPTAEFAEAEWAKLNDDQRLAADTIVNALRHNEFNVGELFFLDGPGGTGKTFVQNTVMAKLRSQGHIVLAVASSGIAATLLDGGQTAHARFKIPLDSDSQSTCNIEGGTDLSALIKAAKVIFWDEAPMQRKYDMLAVSRTLSDFCHVEDTVPFGGKVVIFCGDFRQTLPVCPNKPRGTIVACCLQHAIFWKDTQILRLTINMRLRDPRLTEQGRRDAAQFAAEVLEVGNATTTLIPSGSKDGWVPWSRGFIKDNTQAGIVKTIYPDLSRNLPDSDYLGERAILAVVNVDVGRINNACVEQLSGNVQLKFSEDKAVDEALREEFPSEAFHNCDEPSLPPHVLRLKVGMPLMILRNLDPPVQCNGTRVRLTRITPHVLETEVISGKCKGERVLIPRIPLFSKDDEVGRGRRKAVPCQFSRRQFPVRPAFAMTINKSQGQSLRVVGIDIRTRECFTHGQLYVALSRVTNKANLHIITPDHGGRIPRRLKNIQWKEVLLPP